MAPITLNDLERQDARGKIFWRISIITLAWSRPIMTEFGIETYKYTGCGETCSKGSATSRPKGAGLQRPQNFCDLLHALHSMRKNKLRRIVHIPYTAHITNEEVRRRTGQPAVTSIIAKRRLRLFGHLARDHPSQDHSRILRAAINRPPADWRRRAGRPRWTWLRHY